MTVQENSKWPKLPKAFKKKWTTALRSGKFKQTQLQLLSVVKDSGGKERKRGYCCLGVAAAISGYGDKKIRRSSLLSNAKDWRKVPAPLRQKKSWGGNPLTMRLSNMNDKGVSFKKIADWIDKNL